MRLFAVLLMSAWAAVPRAALFEDAVGRSVAIDRVPERIVTLAPSLTEIVYFLGLGERVVGVTRYSSFPPEAAAKPKVGSYVDLNVEQIVSLAPDLVIGTADGNQPAVVEILEKAGIPVYIVNPRNLHEVIDTVRDIGGVCGVPERAAALAAGLSARLDTIAAKTAGLGRPTVFLQVNARPIVTVSADTFSSDLIRLAGGRNMADGEPISYPRISVEEVIRQKPEVIVISSMDRGGAPEDARRAWLRLKLIPAAEQGRVHLVDSDLIDRPSPRVLEGLEILARLIHPDAPWDE
jgi:iron complex transport system substrate-binding protein